LFVIKHHTIINANSRATSLFFRYDAEYKISLNSLPIDTEIETGTSIKMLNSVLLQYIHPTNDTKQSLIILQY